jgi:hypothetical protein
MDLGTEMFAEGGDGLFVATARFRDGVDAEAGATRAEALQSLVEGEAPRGWPSEPARGYASVCLAAPAEWMELDG